MEYSVQAVCTHLFTHPGFGCAQICTHSHRAARRMGGGQMDACAHPKPVSKPEVKDK